MSINKGYNNADTVSCQGRQGFLFRGIDGLYGIVKRYILHCRGRLKSKKSRKQPYHKTSGRLFESNYNEYT